MNTIKLNRREIERIKELFDKLPETGEYATVTFPYTAPDEPIYEYLYSDADPQQPRQNENGFID